MIGRRTASHVWLNRKIFPQVAHQRGCPARPQPKNRPQAYPLGYVEELFKTRTKLAGFFSILPYGGYSWQTFRSKTASLKFLAWKFKIPKRLQSLPNILKLAGQKLRERH